MMGRLIRSTVLWIITGVCLWYWWAPTMTVLMIALLLRADLQDYIGELKHQQRAEIIERIEKERGTS